jgi:hypothetical protein
MSVIETLKPSALLPPREALRRVFDRKLRTVLGVTRVEPREFEDKIIEGSPEIVASLPNQSANPERHGDDFAHSYYDFARVLRIELPRSGVVLRIIPDRNSSLKLTKVFVCPIYSFKRAIEWMDGHVVK